MYLKAASVASVPPKAPRPAASSFPPQAQPPARALIYCRHLRARSGIRVTALALAAAGVALPAVRRRLHVPAPVVLAGAGLAPVALCVAVPRSRRRSVAICALQMWAYLAAYELPHDDPQRQRQRVHVGYPIAIDRILGLGDVPSVRLQRRFSRPGRFTAPERLLVCSHWVWFGVPHASLVYVLLRAPQRFPGAAARMYTVFDLGACAYWFAPTAPPWWAAREGALRGRDGFVVRRMMSEYGSLFWGERWERLYDLLGGNPLAAMPSLHFATSVMAARVLAEVDALAGALGWAYTATLGVALVYLGEHYVADVIAGGLLAEAVQALTPRLGPIYERAGLVIERLQRLGCDARPPTGSYT
jgi:membrane-associated phospholipid phosphatase